jgi:hypothetical protein
MLHFNTPGKACLSVLRSNINSLSKAKSKGIDRVVAEAFDLTRSHVALRYRPPAFMSEPQTLKVVQLLGAGQGIRADNLPYQPVTELTLDGCS